MTRDRSKVGRLTALVAGLALVLGTAACGGESGTDGTEDPTSSTTTSVDVTIEGGTVEPNGKRIDVAKGEPLELVVTSDAPGTMHVHSTPEQELSFEAGTTTLEFTIDQPGVVDVELHDPETTVLQLEVR